MAQIIDGKKIAADVRAQVAAEVQRLVSENGLKPGLAVVLVGEDPASKVYVKNKAQQTVEVGMNSWEHRLPAETSEADVLALVDKLNNDPACHGILVQLPLPKHINSEKVLNSINPDKDVDGFHPVNVGRLWVGERALVPCTPTGSVILAKTVAPSLAGLNAVVIGRSNIVGKPVAALLLRENCTVTVAHSRTKDLAGVGRLDQAGRHRDRRRHQPHHRTGRQGQARWRCELCGVRKGGGRHYARSGRCGPHDNRLPAAQCGSGGRHAE
jgi:methylenetetrahydrofolate dehydrogenase (NADP+)/methenyltetrahydrofolate cyclohydrolase